VWSVLVCAGCSSKPESSPAETSKSSSSLTKAQQAEADLDAQLTEPPAKVVAALGAEVYPGARMLKSMASMRSSAASDATVDYMFFTSDSPEKVRDFYERKLAGAHRGELAFVVKGTNTHGQEVTVQAQARGATTTFHFVVLGKK
jgi:hypothetical protein